MYIHMEKDLSRTHLVLLFWLKAGLLLKLELVRVLFESGKLDLEKKVMAVIES